MHLAHHDNPGHLGIRTKTHKLIYYYGCNYAGEKRTPPAWELYDLVNDPDEVHNLYDDPGQADLVTELKERLAALRKRVGDTGEDYPEVEAIVQEFWDYDDADRAKAIALSHAVVAERTAKSAPSKKAPKQGKTKGASAPIVKKDGWIESAPSQTPLRTRKRLTEISRTAVYQIHPEGPKSYNPDNAHLLSGTPPQSKAHAFHTTEGADTPHVIIRLDKAQPIHAIDVINRISNDTQMQARATGLTLWLSTDGTTWGESVWHAPAPAATWTITLAEPTHARFVKLGLPDKGTLHLNQVIVYGKH